MISHRNVIANVLQTVAYEKNYRDSLKEPGSKYDMTEVTLGLLPQSHIYALILICHATTYRGDQVINVPKFEMQQLLTCIAKFKINMLSLVSSFTCYPTSHPFSESLGFQRTSTAVASKSSLANTHTFRRYRQSLLAW